MLKKNGQPPPEINDEDSHLNEDLDSYNNLLGLGGSGSLYNPDSCMNNKKNHHLDSNSSFVADEKKEV